MSTSPVTSDGAGPMLAGPELNGITRLSASDTVRARIALAVDLELIGPDERLPPDAEIAQALDVSEMTVRRALEAMAEDGLVERRRGRNGGTFATGRRMRLPDAAVEAYRADAATVHRLIDERTLYECALAHHAALAATPQQLGSLRAHVDEAARAQDWTAYHHADERFHRAVAQASGLDWAAPLYAGVLERLYRYFIPYPIDRLRAANEDHAQIVAAFADRDPVRAVEVMRAHVQELHHTMFIGDRFAPREG
ncbi:FadR/GntR family transcriptional regulator [Microbacterium luticocti]|uniref:FadR/GntR family transcriptional regulator n=1 Tax=Microbacterium luticocti TaxID=451764 RepID=UPI0004256E3C|nr:FCD domain-containing protein [Microbacterium luticocti]